MCGRYVFRQPNKHNPIEALPWGNFWNDINLPEARCNIAPTQLAPIITSQGVKPMAFGIHPSWSKTSLINAKSENIISSRYWKPMAAMYPCLIPADGFYEPKGEKGTNRPWYGFEFSGSKPFLMAGLYTQQDNEPHFVILTKQPNSLLEPIHSRMPVILTNYESETMKLWMDTTADLIVRANTVGKQIEFEDLICFPVSDKVKNPRNEGIELFYSL